MDMEEVKYESRDGVGLIRIERENRLNPLNVDILSQIVELVEGKPGVKVITGSNRAFSAGADIKGFVGIDGPKAHEFSLRGQDLLRRIENYRHPVIAAIEGYALGGGLELSLACDIRVVHPTARLGLTESTLGLIPGWGGTQRLKRYCGEEYAFYMITTGKIISGDEAVRKGLASFVSDDPLSFALEIAGALSKRSSLSLSSIKELVRDERADLFDREAELFGKVFDGEDSKEGISAFLEKREPHFKGK